MSDERAVSPVIGVILMVAIAVILAAVIGTFVLDYGQQAASEVPQVTFDANFNDSHVTVTHEGGNAITEQRTTSLTLNATDGNSTAWDLPVSAGDSVALAVSADTTVRVIWSGSNADSHILAEFQVP